MKKVLKICFSILAVALIISFSVINCFAKGNLFLDSGVSVPLGDTVTYTLYLADCEEPVTDMVANLFYDSEYLELDKDSLDFHDLVGVARNVDIDGSIPFSFSTLGSPVDFSEKKAVVSADFKVLKDGESAIKYFITDLDCGGTVDNASVKQFTFTCDYVIHTADGDVAKESMVPRLLDDESKLNEYQGDFINYVDGKGEQAGYADDHIAVTGEGEVIDVSKGDTSENNNSTIIITVAVIVIILVAVIIVVLRRVFAPNENTENEDDNDETDTESGEDDQ